MARIASLTGILTLDSNQFDARLNASTRKLDSAAASMQRNLQSVDRGFNKLSGTTGLVGQSITSLARSILPIVGIGGLAAMVKGALDAAGGLGELSEQLGISTDLIQSLRYNAAQSGVEIGQLDSAIQKFGRSIGEAADGSKAQLDAFNELGVGVLDAQGKIRSTEAVLRDVSDALARIPDKATRSRIEVDLFGRAGQQLAPILEHGSGAMDDFTEAARRAGVVLDKQTIAAADRASDAMAALGIKFEAAFQKMAAVLADPATDITNWLENFTVETGKSGLEMRLGRIGEAMKKTRDEIADLSSQIKTSLDDDFRKTIQAALDSAEQRLKNLQRTYDEVAGQRFNIFQDRGEMGRRGLLPVSPLASASHNPPPATSSTGKSQTEKDAERAAAAIAQLQFQIAQLERTPQQQAVAEALRNIGTASNEARTEIAALAAELFNLNDAEKRDAAEVAEIEQIIADATQRYNDRMEEGRQLTESLRTPTETYTDSLATLSEQLKTGAIDHETYSRAVQAAQDTYISTDSVLSQLSDGFSDMGQAGLSALEDLAIEGGNVKGVLNALLKDLARIALRTGVGAAFGGIFSGVGDWLGSALVGLFHDGGTVGGVPTSRRRVPIEAFAGAPRLHTGGWIGPNERPIIARVGERVVTPEEMAQWGDAGPGGSVTNISVTVNGSAGTRAQNQDLAQQTAAAIDRVIEDKIERSISRHLRTGGMLNPGLGR
jgi:hypothetical protein